VLPPTPIALAVDVLVLTLLAVVETWIGFESSPPQATGRITPRSADENARVPKR